jgi:hypothetical protein
MTSVADSTRPGAASGASTQEAVRQIVIPIQPVAAPAGDGDDGLGSLYARRKEIYPRAKIGDRLGVFQRWRWAAVWITQLVFYGLPWLQWNDRQAVLFDMAARKFYIFGLVLWPQDFIFLTWLLILGGLSLFFFTALAGRLWEIFAAKPAQRTEMGHAGRHFLNTNFGQAAIVGDYLNLYGQLLAKVGA